MITKDIEKLSAVAKEMVMFFAEHPNVNHKIVATTDGCILDPDILLHVKNIKALLSHFHYTT